MPCSTSKNSSSPEGTRPTALAGPLTTALRPGRLSIRWGDNPPEEIDLKDGRAFSFGRSRAANFVIRDHSVSKVHFTLRAVAGGVEMEDLGSRNGTWYAGRSIRRMTLRAGDEFWAGGCTVRLLEIGEVKVKISARKELGLLFGESVAMREVFATMEKLASAPIDLLIAGETGTGKELTARTLHNLSNRADKPFVTLDCSTLASTLADATIFGFRRGAFTGAEYDQPGLFEQANSGTLFIDEVGELTPALQMKFLRAIDCGEVTRLGEPGRVRKVDVRVLAATNRDLMTDVEGGRFRSDLYHRFGHAALRLPSLRERGLDVIALAELFIRELPPPEGQDGDELPVLADDAKTLLLAYDWPGNVRELKSAVRRAVYVCKGGVLKSEDFSLGRPEGWAHRLAKAVEDGGGRTYEEMHQLIDRVYLPTVLEQSQTITEAALRLGITRARLRGRLRTLGLYDTEPPASEPSMDMVEPS